LSTIIKVGLSDAQVLGSSSGPSLFLVWLDIVTVYRILGKDYPGQRDRVLQSHTNAALPIL
jgi:hypothetical protein